jgi:hypothetical protein
MARAVGFGADPVRTDVVGQDRTGLVVGQDVEANAAGAVRGDEAAQLGCGWSPRPCIRGSRVAAA